ncbi:MAG: hypothetical protein SPL71_05070 [Oribacterium sp.]|nr:hypothetical protein [Oribacterium sp.]
MKERQSKTRRKSKSWKKLPRFTVQLETFIQKADMKEDLLTVDSYKNNLKYVADEEAVIIVTATDGYLKLPLDEIAKFTADLREVAEVISYWKRS